MKTRRRADAQTRSNGTRHLRACAPARLCVLLLCVCASARLRVLSAQETSLTIYSDGRLLVRRTLPLAVPRGTSTLPADLGVRGFDASSLVSLDSGVQIAGAHISAAIGLEGSLRRAIGTDVFFRQGNDSAAKYVRARVLSVDPPAVRFEGNVMYGWPGTPVFPDSMVQLSPRYELTLDAAQPASALRLLFMSSGLSWHAAYAALLPRGGAGRASVTGAAELDNQGAVSISGAQVQLLAGDVRGGGGQPRFAIAGAAVMQAAPQPAEEAVGEVHVYTLPGTVDFVPGESRTIALFPAASVQVTQELVLRGSYGFQMQPDEQRDQHPEVTYRLHRPAGSDFGGVVVPGGTLRLFEPDSAGRRQLVGEVSIPHTPAGRDILAVTGTAFDVTAQRTQTEFQRSGARETTSGYSVQIENARAQPATIVVSETCPGRCDVLSSSVPAEQGSAGTVSFRVSVPANGQMTLTYRVRARW